MFQHTQKTLQLLLMTLLDTLRSTLLSKSPKAAKASKMVQASVSELVRNAAEPLPPIDDPSFGSHFDRFGQSRVVLIGDAR